MRRREEGMHVSSEVQVERALVERAAKREP
jgi:hypothetical protein